MKKRDLFIVLDDHQRQIEQLKTISEILSNASADIFLPESHQRALASISADICDMCLTQAETISQALVGLYMIDNAVNGNSD
jgi:hypothetical protein